MRNKAQLFPHCLSLCSLWIKNLFWMLRGLNGPKSRLTLSIWVLNPDVLYGIRPDPTRWHGRYSTVGNNSMLYWSFFRMASQCASQMWNFPHEKTPFWQFGRDKIYQTYFRFNDECYNILMTLNSRISIVYILLVGINLPQFVLLSFTAIIVL